MASVRTNTKLYGSRELNVSSIVGDTQNDLQRLITDLCQEYIKQNNINSCIHDIDSYISHIFRPSQSSFNLSKTDINNRMIGFFTLLMLLISVYISFRNESQSGYHIIGWIMMCSSIITMILFVYLILFTSSKLHQYRVHLINISNNNNNSGIYVPIEFISKQNYVTTSISDISSMRGSTTQKLLTSMSNILSIFGISACIMKISQYNKECDVDEDKLNVILLLFSFIGPLLLGNFEINNQTGSYKERLLKQTIIHFSGVILFVVIGPYSYWRFKQNLSSYLLFISALSFCFIYLLMRCCSLEIRNKIKIFPKLFDLCCYWIRTTFDDKNGDKKESLFVKVINDKETKKCGYKMSVKSISLIFIFIEFSAVSIAMISCILFVMDMGNTQ